MDEIQITIRPRTVERAIFIIIILVLVVLLVLKTIASPAGSTTATTTTAAASTTTLAAAATTATEVGATTAQQAGTSTSTVKATTTTKKSTTLEANLGAQVVDVIYVKLNATVYGESYAASRRKMTAIKLQITNDYIVDLDLRAKVYFYDSQDDEEAKDIVQATLTIPAVKIGETVSYTGEVMKIFANLNLEKTIRVDFLPRAGAGDEVLKTITYKFKAK